MNNKELLDKIKYISLTDIELYLRNKGWKIKNHPNSKINVFQGLETIYGRPLEIILPSNSRFKDTNIRILDAMKILSNIENKKVEVIFNEVNLISHDILKSSINDVDDNSSIPLPIAADHVNALKDLLIYSASSEKDSRPYFERPLSVGQNYANMCGFGHTFEGSFGFTINSPISSEFKNLSLFKENMPITFERKVIERIIRSLSMIDKSLEEDDPDILVDNFDIAANSKMCESLLVLSQGKTQEISFDINWSYQMQVSEDLLGKRKWKLDQKAFDIVEYAAVELKKIEPYDEIIIGKIVTLHSNKNPMSDDDFPRYVIVKHEYEGKTIHVKIYLDKEGYNIAYNAHGRGLPIKVKGELFRKGSTWKMINVNKISF